LVNFKIFIQGDIVHDVIESNSISKEFTLKRYSLAEYNIGDKYSFKFEIYFKDFTNFEQVDNCLGVGTVPGSIEK